MMKAYRYLVDEFDVVLNLGYIKSGYVEKVKDEILRLCEWNKYPYKLKLIVEAPLLTAAELIETVVLIAKISQETPRINFIKTATGRHGSTTEDHVKNIRFALGKGYPNLGIKVAGGVRTVADIKKFDSYEVQLYGVGYPHFLKLIEEARCV